MVMVTTLEMLFNGEDGGLWSKEMAQLVVCLCFMFMAPSLFWLSVILVAVHRSHTSGSATSIRILVVRHTGGSAPQSILCFDCLCY